LHTQETKGKWTVHPPALISSTPFSENILVRFVDGHTNGMMLPQINYNGKTVVFMADLLPSQGHIPIPYIMAYDMQPLISMTEKRSFLKKHWKKTTFFSLNMTPCMNVAHFSKPKEE
jgi:hypothetical protein